MGHEEWLARVNKACCFMLDSDEEHRSPEAVNNGYAQIMATEQDDITSTHFIQPTYIHLQSPLLSCGNTLLKLVGPRSMNGE